MRRAILVFLLAVGVFAGAALGGFYAASRLAPERLRAEAESRLSALARAPVRLESVRVSLTEDLPWLRLEATGLRADPLPGGSSLAVEQVSARIDPFLLVLGRLELRALQLAGVDLSMPAPAGAAEREEAAPDPLSHAVSLLDAAAVQLRGKPCPIPPLEAERLSLSLTSASAPRRVVEVDLASFRCARIRGVGSWDVTGRVLLAEGEAAPFSAELSASEDEVEATLETKSAQLAGVLAALGQRPGLGGEVSATLDWRAAPDAPHELHLELAGKKVAGSVGAADPARALALDLAAPRIEATLTASARELRTSRLSVEDGDLRIAGKLSIALPFGERSAIRAQLSTAGVDRDDLLRIARQLPPRLRANLDGPLGRSVAGRVPKLEVELDSDLTGLRAIAGGDLPALTSDLTLALSVENAELLVGTSDRLRDVTGTLAFTGDTLEIHALGARFRERRLPRLSAKVVGLRNVRSLEDVRCERPSPVPPLAGIDDLRAWVDSRRKPPYVQTWTTLELDVDRVSHPTLLCTLEQAVAEVARGDNGYDLAIENGSWAGFAIEAKAQYRKGRGKDGQPARDGGAVMLDLALGKPQSPAPPREPSETWAEGRFAVDVRSMGRFLTRGYDGAFRATGAGLELYDSRLRLHPSGELQGRLVLRLGEHGPVPFEVDAQSQGLDLLDVWKTSQLPRPIMSGTLVGGASLRGHLLLGQNPLVDVSGYGSLHARDGQIYRSVPFLLAVAMADEKINPFGKRDRFPYRAIDLEGPAEGGWLFSRTLTLEGKSERMAASGKTHLAEPYELESVIGMYPIPTLDSIVAQIPLVNLLLLGEDQALAGFYFSVTGEWTKPKVEPLPIKTIASGPAQLVLEGVPNFVLGGLRAIGSVLTPPPPPPKKPEPVEKSKPAELVEPAAPNPS